MIKKPNLKKNIIRAGVLTIALVVVTAVFCGTASVYADEKSSLNDKNIVSADDIMKLALAQSAVRCMNALAADEIKNDDFKGRESIYDDKSSEYENRSFTYGGYAPMLGVDAIHTLEKGYLGCSEALEGKGSGKVKKSLFGTYYKNKAPNSLEDLGYSFLQNNANGNANATHKTTITKAQASSASGGARTEDLLSNKPFIIEFYKDGNKWDINATGVLKLGGATATYSGGDKPAVKRNPANQFQDGLFAEHWLKLSCNKSEAKECTKSFEQTLKKAFSKIAEDESLATSTIDFEFSKVEQKKVAGQDSAAVYYKTENSAKKMLYNIGFEIGRSEAGHNAHTANPVWNGDYIYSLYIRYLYNAKKEYNEKNKDSVIEISCDEKDKTIYKFKNTKDSWCYVSIKKNESDVLNSYRTTLANNGYELGQGRLQDALDWLGNENNYGQVTRYLDADPKAIEAGVELEEEEEDGDGSNDQLAEACNKAAGSLGWIMCPTISGLRTMVTGVYAQVEPMIRVNDSVLDQIKDENSSMYQAWGTFRNIANVIFVILFLFIIFSQLTGYGIDNYGIKKMLPKIIVTAILVNISFVLCAVAVDVSNIVGKAIQEFFTGFANHKVFPDGSSVFAEGSSVVDSTNQIVENVVGILEVAAGGGLVIGAITMAMNGWALIIPILIFLVSMAVSVLVAFLILGVRQALVVVLVISSPIALACTMLPNTENVFKKWKDLFIKVLTVYPVVGGMIGAGYFVASLLYTEENDLIMAIIAGALCVGPYFMVPSMVKKSLAAAGDIGAKLSGLGKNASGRVNKLNDSNWVKSTRANARNNSLATKLANKATIGAAGYAAKHHNPASWLLRHSIASNHAIGAATDAYKARIASAKAPAEAVAAAKELSRFKKDNVARDAYLANVESKAHKAEVEDYSALFGKDGTFSNDVEFEKQVNDAATSGNVSKLDALMQQAASGSDGQREALRKGVDAALHAGSMNRDAATYYASHVLNNPKTYKDKDKSMFDQAKSINSILNDQTKNFKNEQSGLVSGNRVGKSMLDGKQPAEGIFGFDDGEFNAMMGALEARENTPYAGVNINAETTQAIINHMNQAINLKNTDTTGKYNHVKDDTMNRIIDIRNAAQAHLNHLNNI